MNAIATASPAVLPAGLPALIELDGATVLRGQVKVLHALSLRIAQGQHTALLGPNGCGKSTFIKLITRELYPLALGDGRVPVKVLGQARWQVDRLRSQLGIVTGDLSSNLADMPGLTVEQAVLTGFFASYALPGFREISAEMRARATQTLAMTGASALHGRAYAELSAGETRRVLIARALVNQPQALLLDEPSTGLDLVARQQLVDTMQSLARQGITLVLVTHHVEEIIPEIERVVLLRDGRVLADGSRHELLRDGPLSEAFGGQIQLVEREGRLTASVG
ncbi:ABC transporter ATP-binding protein [Stenotrophomonas tumulicola]|uniref:ABC transporter ATP-binding protein n=1 Tax=Stenotrophomonas tumulicola TaxID=1685415 RepID=UPI003CCD713C